jgi:cytidylate kinase
MKPHYDFSKAERGKFYRKGARVRLPIYLDGQLQKRLERIAQKKGRDVGDVVSDLLIKDVELLEGRSGPNSSLSSLSAGTA